MQQDLNQNVKCYLILTASQFNRYIKRMIGSTLNGEVMSLRRMIKYYETRKKKEAEKYLEKHNLKYC